MSSREINLAIIETLKEEALKAGEEGRYLEAGIILFQTVEILLRLVIKVYGRGNSVPELSLTRASDAEQSFSRLVMHLDLVYPGNELAERLRALNEDKPKGNVDAELVLQAMIDYGDYERAVIVTSDGDFACLVRYLYEQGKLERVLSPNRTGCSVLLTRAAREKIDFLDNARRRLEYQK